MNTILTNDEIDAAWDGLTPSGNGKSRYDLARAVIAAYEAKLAQQAPVAWLMRSGKARWVELENPTAHSALPRGTSMSPLYTRPAPQQADRRTTVCVNACEGLETAILEMVLEDGRTIKHDLDEFEAKAKDFQKENERLIEALSNIRAFLASEIECGVFEEHISPALDALNFSSKPKQAAAPEAPAQADRQRVPEGYVLVPVEPTDEMVDAACDKSDFFRVDFVLAWDAAINASPELTQSATSHTHKVVPVTPTKEMLISGARAPVELLSPDGALQVYRAMLAAAPEAPAQAEFVHDPACKMCEGRGYYVAGYSGREDDGNAPIHEECDCWIPNPEAPAQEKSNG